MVSVTDPYVKVFGGTNLQPTNHNNESGFLTGTRVAPASTSVHGLVTYWMFSSVTDRSGDMLT
jgi:hypothetical protein